MKKFLFSILAVGAIVACTKSEVKYEGDTEIAFAPVASTATKADYDGFGAIDDNDYPHTEQFRVWGYWKDVEEGKTYESFTDSKTYIDGAAFKYATGNTWKGAKKSYFWPKTGSMVFACLSPADAPVTDLSHNVTTDNFSFYYSGTDNTSKTKDIMWTDATLSVNEQKDGVPVTFQHALTWITFKVKGDVIASQHFVVNSLVMDEVFTGGTFNSKSKTWNNYTTPLPIKVFEGTQSIKTDYAILENVEAGTLVVPQYFELDRNYSATLKFTNNSGDNPIEETIPLDLGSGWDIGKHYTYYITFTANEILIAPEVTDWDEVKGGEYEF